MSKGNRRSMKTGWGACRAIAIWIIVLVAIGVAIGAVK